MRYTIEFELPDNDIVLEEIKKATSLVNWSIWGYSGMALPKPAVKPERKKGKWLPDNNNYYEERFICSVCGKSYNVDTCMGKPMWDFCPCGADMRGEQE